MYLFTMNRHSAHTGQLLYMILAAWKDVGWDSYCSYPLLSLTQLKMRHLFPLAVLLVLPHFVGVWPWGSSNHEEGILEGDDCSTVKWSEREISG